jgi:protein tyrosine/serine phosphatase
LKIDVLLDAGVRTFVDLTAAADRLEPYQPILDQAAADRALDLRRETFPIPDLGVVADAQYDPILAAVRKGHERGAVYLHCWGGVGRTGSVVGCLLAEQGRSYDEVIARLAELRRGSRKARRIAPETEAQWDLIRRRVGSRSERPQT